MEWEEALWNQTVIRGISMKSWFYTCEHMDVYMKLCIQTFVYTGLDLWNGCFFSHLYLLKRFGSNDTPVANSGSSSWVLDFFFFFFRSWFLNTILPKKEPHLLLNLFHKGEKEYNTNRGHLVWVEHKEVPKKRLDHIKRTQETVCKAHTKTNLG